MLRFGLPDFYDLLVHAIVLFTVIPVHEFAHGYVAYKLGDDTARLQGRLTLNPFAHLDPVGTVALLLVGFGWAKPVPVNPNRFKNRRSGMAISALAGPVANVILALLVMILYKLLIGFGFFYKMPNLGMAQNLIYIFSNIIWVSLCLAVFNLLPIPPLDGYKIFGSILPEKYYFFIMNYEQYIFIVLLLLLTTGVLAYPITWGADLLLWVIDFITKPLNWLF